LTAAAGDNNLRYLEQLEATAWVVTCLQQLVQVTAWVAYSSWRQQLGLLTAAGGYSTYKLFRAAGGNSMGGLLQLEATA